MHRSRAVIAALFALGILATSAEAFMPANIRLHDPSGDAAGTYHSSPSVGAFIADVLAGWLRMNPTQPSPVLAYSYSFNGGGGFIDGGIPPAPAGWMMRADPVVSVNAKTADFYYFGLLSQTGHKRIGVVRGGFVFSPPSFNWSTPQFVSSDIADGRIFLNTLAAVADSASGNLYVLYENPYADAGHIEFYRSPDKGVSWSAPMTLSPPAEVGSVSCPRIAVGPGGEVYAAWVLDAVKAASIRVRKSVDGGLSFAGEAKALQVVVNPIGAPGEPTEQLPPNFSLAVDRTKGMFRGRVYLAWKSSYEFHDDPPLPTGPALLEVEPNDTVTAATPFQVGDVIRGSSSSAPPAIADQDHYSVMLHAGDRFVAWPDSMPPNQTYNLRMVSPLGGNDRIFTSEGSSDSGGFGSVPITFVAPADGTYDLSFTPVLTTGGYRILTGFGFAGAEPGRDQHDIVACYSDDGLSWSAPNLVNHDPIGYDNALPEVLVAWDGMPYVAWNDCHDDLYGTHSHIYLGRSSDGGVTWEAERRVTNAQSYWPSAVNPIWGLGFHLAMATNDQYLHVGWADARVPNTNVYDGYLATGFSLSQCATADTSAIPGENVTLGFAINNSNLMFDQPYVVDFTSDRGWALPSVETEIVPALTNGFPVTAVFQVPDSAAVGTTTLTLHCRNLAGSESFACPVTLHIVNGLVSAGDAPLAFRLGAISPNPCLGPAGISFVLAHAGKARLQLFSADGRLVRTLLDEESTAGAGAAFWDGRDAGGRRAAAGVYFLGLESGGDKAVRQITVVRR